MAQLTNYDAPSAVERGIDNSTDADSFLSSIMGSIVAKHDYYYLVLQNEKYGDTWNLYGAFGGFGLGASPAEGLISEIDRSNGFTLKNINLDVSELFAPPTQVNAQKLMSDIFSGADSITADSAPVNNYILGYDGADTIDASAAPLNDTLFGGAGDDLIFGGTGFNRINGNAGDDTIVGYSRTGDWLCGGQGADSIDATRSAGRNLINGNLGNDTIVGGSGGDTVHGGGGDDLIVGGSGGDWISGDLGANTLTGGAGGDTFHAGPGHDLVTDFTPGQGDRILIDGGIGYRASQAGADVRIDLSNGGQMFLQNAQLSSLGPTSGWIVAG